MTIRKYSDILKKTKKGGGKITKKKQEYRPVRGDIVQWVDGGGEGEVCLVVGWAGKDTLVAKELQNGYTITGDFETCFLVLLRKDQYDEIIKNLPHVIKITDNEPASLQM